MNSVKSGIYKITKYFVMFVLILWSISGIFIGAINPETFILGDKVNGQPALIYLMAGGIIGFGISALVFMKTRIGAILSIGYFSYYLIDSILLVEHFPFFGIAIPVIIGLVLSIVLFGINQKYFQVPTLH